MAERQWVEINSRIIYPLKTQLNWMVQEELIDMTDEVLCFIYIVIRVVQAGIQELLPAWNHHCIPG